jgi:hypothetical protein
MDPLAEQLHGGHVQAGLLPGLPYGGVFTRLAGLDLTSRDLPGELPLADPAADHEHAPLVDDDGRGDAWSFLRVLLRHVGLSKTAKIGGQIVPTGMKQGTDFLGTHMTSS